MPSDIVALIERLEKATGPSRLYDSRIVLCCNPGSHLQEMEEGVNGILSANNEWLLIPPYTASIDAATQAHVNKWAHTSKVDDLVVALTPLPATLTEALKP